MILPDWLLTSITGLIGVLIALVSRQALLRMSEYHTQAMQRLDGLTAVVESARQEMAKHVHDHATGALMNGGTERRMEVMQALMMDHLAHHLPGPKGAKGAVGAKGSKGARGRKS